MQDLYFGDVGDYGKYGLLRALSLPSGSEPGLRLGVVWYLSDVQTSAADGKHVSYLDQPSLFRSCDPVLFDALRKHRDSHARRAVSALEDMRVLPPNTAYFRELLKLDVPNPEGARLAWARAALAASEQCEIVFLDPDNGLEIKSVSPTSAHGAKYVSDSELGLFLARSDQTVIVYQHQPHESDWLEKALERIRGLAEDRPTPYAVIYHRGTQRAYLIAPARTHAGMVYDRVHSLLRSEWSHDFTLVWVRSGTGTQPVIGRHKSDRPEQQRPRGQAPATVHHRAYSYTTRDGRIVHVAAHEERLSAIQQAARNRRRRV